jgi:hypothetical protein
MQVPAFPPTFLTREYPRKTYDSSRRLPYIRMMLNAIEGIGRSWFAAVRRANTKSGCEERMILFDGSHERSRSEMNRAF